MSSEPGREVAFVECDALHRVGIEDREEAEKVVDIIKRYTVHQEKILIRPSAAHIKSCRAFRPGLDTGQQLYRLDHIDFAAYCRDGLYLHHRDLHGAHLRGSRSCGPRTGGDCGRGQGRGRLDNCYILFQVPGEVDFDGLFFVAEIDEPEGLPALSEGNAVVA